jgi:hypothetical protein
MSSTINKYVIHYDGNDGNTYSRNIYVRYEGVWDGQMWVEEDGSPVTFELVTDSEAYVLSNCIAGISTNNEFFYWEEVDDFELPEAVEKAFKLR